MRTLGGGDGQPAAAAVVPAACAPVAPVGAQPQAGRQYHGSARGELGRGVPPAQTRALEDGPPARSHAPTVAARRPQRQPRYEVRRGPDPGVHRRLRRARPSGSAAKRRVVVHHLEVEPRLCRWHRQASESPAVPAGQPPAEYLEGRALVLPAFRSTQRLGSEECAAGFGTYYNVTEAGTLMNLTARTLAPAAAGHPAAAAVLSAHAPCCRCSTPSRGQAPLTCPPAPSWACRRPSAHR